MAKKKQKIEQEQATYEAEVLDSSLEAEIKKYEQKQFSDLIKQIQTEYALSWWFMKPKIDEWALRLKLYNNQKRDKEAIGDPLLFTIHQTVLASLYSDKLSVDFGGWERGDEDIADNLNALAEYDNEDMEKDIHDYEWDWDASFFGRGLSIFMDFDRVTKTPIPECVDMMTWMRDPRAKSVRGDRRGRGAMRFGGREIRLSKGQMEEARVYFDFKTLKQDTSDMRSFVDQNMAARMAAQGFSDTLKFENLVGDNQDHRLLEWFTFWKGSPVIATLADKNKRIVRFTKLDGKKFPIIDRAIYPIAHDWDGVSVPDLVEDKQRARSVVQNLGLKSAKAGLNPMYLYNTNKIKNRNDLNFEFNKHVPVDGDVSGAVSPIERQGVKQEVQWIMNVLDTAAQKATATPDIQQGVQSQTKRTATENQLVASRVDTRYSLSAKIFGWSEKRFWQQWYQLYKKHFKKDIDEKIIRVVGALRATPRKLTHENIVMSTDPDIKIDSKVISDAKKDEQLTRFRAYVKDALAVDPSVNTRFALRQLGLLSRIPKDEIDMLLPPNADELLAEDENMMLEKNKKVEVNPTDDDITHMEIHNKIADTPFKFAHIQAHKKNMLLKKIKPELFPQVQRPGQMPENGDQVPVNSQSQPMPIPMNKPAQISEMGI
jgi:hypothetical protein